MFGIPKIEFLKLKLTLDENKKISTIACRYITTVKKQDNSLINFTGYGNEVTITDETLVEGDQVYVFVYCLGCKQACPYLSDVIGGV